MDDRSDLDALRRLYLGDVDSHHEMVKSLVRGCGWLAFDDSGKPFATTAYVPHQAVRQLMDDERDLCLGFKGSGKSMIYQMLLRAPDIACYPEHEGDVPQTEQAEDAEIAPSPVVTEGDVPQTEQAEDDQEKKGWLRRCGRGIARWLCSKRCLRLCPDRYCYRNSRAEHVVGAEDDVGAEPVIICGLDFRSPRTHEDKALLEKVAAEALQQSEAPARPEPGGADGAQHDEQEEDWDRSRTGGSIATSSIRGAWLNVLARSILRGLGSDKERALWIRQDWFSWIVLLVPLLVGALCGLITRQWPSQWSTWFWALLSGLLLGLWFIERRLPRILPWLSVQGESKDVASVYPDDLLSYMGQAQVTKSCKPAPMIWRLSLALLGISGLVDITKLECKGVTLGSAKQVLDPIRTLESVNAYLRTSRIRLFLFIDNIEHAVDVRSTDTRALLLDQFFAVFRGFREEYERIILKVFVRTDLAAESRFSDRTQLATRYAHVQWEPRKVWRLLAKRLLANDLGLGDGFWGGILGSGQPKDLCDCETVEPEWVKKAEENLFGGVFPSSTPGELRENCTLYNDKGEPEETCRKPKKLKEFLEVYLRDGMGGIEPRFLLRWAEMAAKEELRLRDTEDTASETRPLIRSASVWEGVKGLRRYVRDEIVNDYHYILDDFRKQCLKQDVEGETQAKDNGDQGDASYLKAIRGLYYHGLLSCDPNVDCPERVWVVGLFKDAMRQPGDAQ